MNNNFISILSDTTMKYLMKEERTRNIYLELFSHIIGIDLSNYKIIDNELNSGNKRKDYRLDLDRKSTRLNSSHSGESRMPSSA